MHVPSYDLMDLLYSLRHRRCNNPTAHTLLRLLYMYFRAPAPYDIPNCEHTPVVSALAVMVVVVVEEQVLAVMVSVLVAMAFVLALMAAVGQVLDFAVVSAPASTAAK